MGWLDANDYLLMEAMARDRIDDLRREVDPDSIDEDEARGTPRGCPQLRRPALGRGSLEVRRPRDSQAAFGALAIPPRPRPG